MQSRRDFVKSAAAALACGGFTPLHALAKTGKPQRTVVVMFDGFGLDYLALSDSPTLRRWQKQGLYKEVQGVMPSVTNANNTSICCGIFPIQHSITGNSYFNTKTGEEEYMEAADLVLAPTLFERAARVEVHSALLSSKQKTISLLSRGASLMLTPEDAPAEWVNRLGPPPAVYSREINYWLFRAAIHILKERPEILCLYVHTTDYPMHTWAPDTPESRTRPYRRRSSWGGERSSTGRRFPGDGGSRLNFKSRAYDLDKMLAASGNPIRISISAERDKYLKHHLGLGGTSWVYLKTPEDQEKVKAALLKLPGVELVLTREEAVARFQL